MSISINLSAAAATLAVIGALPATAIDAGAATKAGATKARPTATTSRIQAAPTNPSSKEQRQKCAQWTARLQNAAGMTLQVNGSASTGQPSAAVEAVADKAMDDGCVVIY